jgi:hypothetical protein
LRSSGDALAAEVAEAGIVVGQIPDQVLIVVMKELAAERIRSRAAVTSCAESATAS